MHVLEADSDEAPRASLQLPAALDSLVCLRGRGVDARSRSTLGERVTVFCDEVNPPRPDFFSAGLAPVVSPRFLAALDALGVDNHETYTAIIEDLEGEVSISEHRVLNFIGRVASVDLERSRYNSFEGVLFKLETMRLRGGCDSDVLMFRPDEWPLVILVRDEVAEGLRQAGLTGLRLTPVDEWENLDF